VRKLLDNIADGFLEMDNALKKMNESIKSNLTQANVKRLLSETIPLLRTQLKEIKLNMAAFDLAVNAQQVKIIEEAEKRSVMESKASYIDTADGLLKNKSQLEAALNPPSVLTPSLKDLIELINEWEFLLRKHIQTVDKII
jgi:hypothetical protein